MPRFGNVSLSDAQSDYLQGTGQRGRAMTLEQAIEYALADEASS